MTEYNKPIPPCLIFVSKEGKWYHQGAEIIHRPIFLWLIQSLEKTEDGLFIVNLNNEKCFLEVEDTPLVVRQVNLVREGPEEKDQIRLTLNDETQEILDPETVGINKESVLYCQVKNRRFPARFLRPAYYQLAETIVEEDNGEFVLLLDKKKYPIKKLNR